MLAGIYSGFTLPFQQAVRDLLSSLSMSAVFTNISDVRMLTIVLRVEHDRDVGRRAHGRGSHSVSSSYVYTSARNSLKKAAVNCYSYTGPQRRI